MRFSELSMLKFRRHSESEVKPEDLVVERPLWLDALSLDWLGVIGVSLLHGL